MPLVTPTVFENGRVEYPWDKWMKKKKMTFLRGKHYFCTSHSMNIQIRQAAIARGFRASVKAAENPERLIVLILEG